MKRMIALCDCHGDSSDVAATHNDVVLRLDDMEVTLDICDVDWTKLTKAITPFIEAGRRPDSFDKVGRKKRHTPAQKPCEYCGKPVTPGAGRGLHIKSAHPAEWDAEMKKRELVNA
jgi:hypothetical protein